MGGKYSADEFHYLEDNWRSKSHLELGNHLGRTERSIRNRLWRSGWVTPLRWTEEEVNALRLLYSENIGQIKLEAFAQSISKLKSNVSRKARELGLVTNRHRLISFEDRSPKQKERIRKHQQSPIEKHQRISSVAKERIKKYGHPRGYRELRICLVCGRFFDKRHSDPQKYCSKRCADRRRHTVNLYSRGKGGKRADLGNVYFRSRYEANYARYLNFLIKNGDSDIDKWEFEAENFEFKKIKRGGRSYTPDFKITFRDGHIEYHEVKGWDYPKGITARKRMAKYYPHIKLVLVGEEFFNSVRSQGFDRLIPEWE